MQALETTPATPATADLPTLLGCIDGLPSIPLVAQKVGEMVLDPRTDSGSIADVMRGDPALTAKVLRLVNSPYFGIPGGVSDVPRAIGFLGFTSLHQLVLTVSVFQVLNGPKDRVCRLFRHSLATGAAAEVIAKGVHFSDSAACFSAGLLHDLGRLALLKLEDTHGPFPRAMVNQVHPTVGEHLATRWRFPDMLRIAIAHHSHTPARGVSAELACLVDITVLSDLLTRRRGYGLEDEDVPELPPALLSRLGLCDGVEEEHDELLREAMEKSEMMLEVLLA